MSVTTNPKEGNQFTKAISYNTWTSGTSTQTNTFSFTFPSESENKEEIQRYAVYYDEKAPTAIVTIRSANTNQGTVSPSITDVEYEVSSTVYTMRATAKSGYLFDHWSDGNTNAYRQVVFNQAIRYEYVAYFKAKPMAHLKVTSNDTNLGIVTPDYSTYRSVNPGSYTLKATPKENCGFVKWSDDNTDATRTVTCLANNYYSYTAYFERTNAVVNVSSNNTSYGTVTGGGIYHIGDVVTLEATPLDGYVFIGWTGTDDNTKPNTTLTITENTTYNCVASFGSKSYGFIGDDKVSLNGSTPSIISYGNGGFDPTNTYLRADMNASNYGYGTGVRYLITSKYGRNYRAWYNNSTRYYFDNNDPIRILMEAGDTTGPCISKIEVECYSGNLSGQVFTYTRDSFVNEVTELGGKTFTSYIDIPVKNGIYGDNVGQNIIVYFENE